MSNDIELLLYENGTGNSIDIISESRAKYIYILVYQKHPKYYVESINLVNELANIPNADIDFYVLHSSFFDPYKYEDFPSDLVEIKNKANLKSGSISRESYFMLHQNLKYPMGVLLKKQKDGGHKIVDYELSPYDLHKNASKYIN